MIKRLASLAFVSVASLALALAAPAPAAPDAATRFDKLKALAGEWTRDGGDGSVASTYRVTAGGSAVVETMMPGTNHEMVTVYTVDNGDLVLTHYCAQGNQPHMKAVRGGDPNTIEFKFDGAGNLKSPKDGHMHDATFTFTDATHLTTSWQYYQDGKPGELATFHLVRKAS